MTFGFLDRGRQKKAAGEGGKKNKNALYRNPLDVSFFLPLHTNTIPLASVTGPAFLNSQPFFFFFLFTSLSLTVLENPTLSSAGDQSSKLSPSHRMRSRIPGLSADL